MQVGSLLDRAKVATSSDAATARELGVSSQRISDWRNGRVSCPLHVQIKLCSIGQLSTAEAWEHMREVAGVVGKKTAQATTAAVVLACAGLLAMLGAPTAAHAGGHDGDNRYYVN